MNRIDATFRSLRAAGRAAFIPFLVAGDPNKETFLDIIAAIEPVADIIELGIPFTDPVADGPVIQAADARALAAGVSLSRAIGLLAAVRSMTSKPIVVLTYANVVGVGERLARTMDALQAAGVDGIVIADACFEESSTFREVARARGMHLINLVAPTTSPERLCLIIAAATGFVYLVAVKGVTGARAAVVSDTRDLLARVLHARSGSIPVPACVGFGISSPVHAAEIASLGADGIIVGSALVQQIQHHLDDTGAMIEAVEMACKHMRAAIAKAAGGGDP